LPVATGEWEGLVVALLVAVFFGPNTV